MEDKVQLRKDAYQYILRILGRIPASEDMSGNIQTVPLEELRTIKEGIADPSPALVSMLKEWLAGSISDSEIDSHLIYPFQK